MMTARTAIFIIFLSIVFFLGASFIHVSFFGKGLHAETLQANAAVSSSSVFAGEPFVFQIQVSGSENPDKPDLSGIKDFSVEYRGGQQNSSRSMTIVNGQVTQNVRRGYFFSYELTPKRTGKLIVPSITVRAGGQSIHTKPVIITVKKPAETDDFKLRLYLSKSHCYVGEPVILTVRWYLGKDVKRFNFSLPVLENDLFYFIDPEVKTDSGKQYYKIPLGDGQVIGEKGQGRLDNRAYATLTFRKVLIPKRAGEVKMAPATVACEALSGYRNGRGRFNDDFFSDFFKDDIGRKGVYTKVVVPSNALSLSISNLPLEGRPADFDGHVGEYRISASASPTQVSVGDPMTLKITLNGPEYLDHVGFPRLSTQKAVKKDFKIPEERAMGEVSGRSKVFTQTLRALRSDVKEIPSIQLSYFDTRTGSYEVARTKPIPLTVKAAKVVTALDAEGRTPTASKKIEVETWNSGIAYNYDDMSVVAHHPLDPLAYFKTSLWICLMIFPPFFYLVLAVFVGMARRRHADPLAHQARKAYNRLIEGLKKAQHTDRPAESCEIILTAFRDYLGSKLRIPLGAMTFGDVRDRLSQREVGQETLEQLKNTIEMCEAARYAGQESLPGSSGLLLQSFDLARSIEKKLK